MGIYSSGKILGIKIYNFNDDDLANILLEKTYNKPMSNQEMKNAYLFYTDLTNNNINASPPAREIHFQYYTECSSTYGAGTYFNWCPMQLNLFLEKFGTNT